MLAYGLGHAIEILFGVQAVSGIFLPAFRHSASSWLRDEVLRANVAAASTKDGTGRLPVDLARGASPAVLELLDTPSMR